MAVEFIQQKYSKPFYLFFQRTNLHRHQRYNHQYLWKPSTFFPDLYVPVNMDEQENAPGPSLNTPPTAALSATSSQNYLLPTDYHHQTAEKDMLVKNETELQLQLLKRIKAEKIKEQESDGVGLFRHYEYRVCLFWTTYSWIF